MSRYPKSSGRHYWDAKFKRWRLSKAKSPEVSDAELDRKASKTKWTVESSLPRWDSSLSYAADPMFLR